MLIQSKKRRKQVFAQLTPRMQTAGCRPAGHLPVVLLLSCHPQAGWGWGGDVQLRWSVGPQWSQQSPAHARGVFSFFIANGFSDFLREDMRLI